CGPALRVHDDIQISNSEGTMRRSPRVRLFAGLVLVLSTAAPAAAQDAEILRRELEQMRRQLQETQAQYQKSIDALGERIRRLESQPQPVAAPPPAAPAPIAMQAPGPAAPPPTAPSAMDLLRRREPFALYSTRGQGQ